MDCDKIQVVYFIIMARQTEKRERASVSVSGFYFIAVFIERKGLGGVQLHPVFILMTDQELKELKNYKNYLQIISKRR